MLRLQRRALCLASLAAFCVVWGVACASPTLPLPPPETPDIETAGLPAGEVQVVGMEGSALPNAFIISINDDPKLPDDKRVSGTQVNEDGSWRIPIVFASSGDVLQITQQEGIETSPSITVQIQ
jgi:hypothetical protein